MDEAEVLYVGGEPENVQVTPEVPSEEPTPAPENAPE